MKTSSMIKTLWIVPETAGGIQNYASVLVAPLAHSTRIIVKIPKPAEIADAVKKDEISLIHLQHEFGLFGSKLPGLNRFPKWFAAARGVTPGTKWVATAHTVLDAKWRYSTAGRGWKSVPFSFFNLLLPLLRKNWLEKTWRDFDAVIVHSEHQVATIRASGCPKVVVIPHFVPSVENRSVREPELPSVLLFGYFSPEKGQDIAIRAWHSLGKSAPKLILAGGMRRPEDQTYFKKCVDLIESLGLRNRIEITGFVPSEQVTEYFSRATLVIAPFRETSGSGSLATAVGHGAAVLASDLALNLEIVQRVPGSLAFFSSESPEELAEKVRALLADFPARQSLRAGAIRYAEAYSVEKIADLHQKLYAEILQ